MKGFFVFSFLLTLSLCKVPSKKKGKGFKRGDCKKKQIIKVRKVFFLSVSSICIQK